MPTPRPTAHAVLAAACDEVGVRAPRPRQHRDTWIRRAIGRHRAEELDATWLDRARRYLEAGWAASRRRDGETCARMLHGAVTMLRLGDAWAHYLDSPVSDDDPDMRGLGYVDRHVPEELSIRGTVPERTLVFYLMKDRGPVVGEESWMEGAGLAHDAYMLDDGSHRVAFADEWDAAAAARGWDRWPKRGRGLPYLDNRERREARAEEAGDPRTSEERLAELLEDPADEVRVELARNPATPAWIELELGALGDYDVFEALSERRNLLRVTVRRLIEFGDPDLCARALRNGHLTEEMREALRTNDALAKGLCMVAGLEGLPMEALRLLAEHPLWGDDAEEHLRKAGADARPPAKMAPAILRRSYTIGRWTRWDGELHGFAMEFHQRFGVFPNILLANEVTFARIDMAARKERILADDGSGAAEGEHTPLSSFVGPRYELEFAIDPELGDAVVSLIHDTDPDGGGEPVPEQDTPVEAVGAVAAVRVSSGSSSGSCSC